MKATAAAKGMSHHGWGELHITHITFTFVRRRTWVPHNFLHVGHIYAV